jgi:hypothetical protein
MDTISRVLTEPSNYAVVQLPDRKYPGVVFQGDSLNALTHRLRGALRAASVHNDEALNAELEDALALLEAARDRLKTVCAREGVELPFA